jgi:hypothetical protein
MRDDQQDGGREGGKPDKDAATHDGSPVKRDQAIGMIGVAEVTAIAAKRTAPTNETAMRWAASKRNDMVIILDFQAPDHPVADIEGFACAVPISERAELLDFSVMLDRQLVKSTSKRS